MPRRIILDTDIGTDIDDAYALAFVLASPELDLVGVTVANNRTSQRAQLALKLLHLAGREDVPVAVGRATQTGGSVNQFPWAADYADTQSIPQSAAEFIVEQVNAAPGEITVLPIGPLTNVGDALSLDPSLPEKLDEVVLMGGSVGWPGGATPEPVAEYNIVTDIPAAQATLACGARLTLVPLDATYQVKLEAQSRARLQAAGTPLAMALAQLLPLWPGETPVLHDPLAVAMAIDPTLCGISQLNVVCDAAGYTRVVEGDPNMQVAVTPQVGRFLHLFMERLLNHLPGTKP